EVDGTTTAAEERREDSDADRRDGDAKGDQAAERERRALEEAVARVALDRDGGRSAPRARRVVTTHPGPSRSEGDCAAERRNHQRANDQPDEQDGDADCQDERRDGGSGRLRPSGLLSMAQVTSTRK